MTMSPSEMNAGDGLGEQDVPQSCSRWNRDWLRQLILKHAHNHPNMPQDLKEKALVVVRAS
jgi:hypothetical protein